DVPHLPRERRRGRELPHAEPIAPARRSDPSPDRTRRRFHAHEDAARRDGPHRLDDVHLQHLPRTMITRRQLLAFGAAVAASRRAFAQEAQTVAGSGEAGTARVPVAGSGEAGTARMPTAYV